MYWGVSMRSNHEFEVPTVSHVAPAHLSYRVLQQQFLKYQHVAQPTLNSQRFPWLRRIKVSLLITWPPMLASVLRVSVKNNLLTSWRGLWDDFRLEAEERRASHVLQGAQQVLLYLFHSARPVWAGCPHRSLVCMSTDIHLLLSFWHDCLPSVSKPRCEAVKEVKQGPDGFEFDCCQHHRFHSLIMRFVARARLFCWPRENTQGSSA